MHRPWQLERFCTRSRWSRLLALAPHPRCVLRSRSDRCAFTAPGIPTVGVLAAVAGAFTHFPICIVCRRRTVLVDPALHRLPRWTRAHWATAGTAGRYGRSMAAMLARMRDAHLLRDRLRWCHRGDGKRVEVRRPDRTEGDTRYAVPTARGHAWVREGRTGRPLRSGPELAQCPSLPARSPQVALKKRPQAVAQPAAPSQVADAVPHVRRGSNTLQSLAPDSLR